MVLSNIWKKIKDFFIGIVLGLLAFVLIFKKDNIQPISEERKEEKRDELQNTPARELVDRSHDPVRLRARIEQIDAEYRESVRDQTRRRLLGAGSAGTPSNDGGGS